LTTAADGKAYATSLYNEAEADLARLEDAARRLTKREPEP
jgi:hypothetical protein